MNNESLLQRRYRLLGEKAPLFYDDPIHIVKGYCVWLEDSAGICTIWQPHYILFKMKFRHNYSFKSFIFNYTL